jgi:HD domain
VRRSEAEPRRAAVEAPRVSPSVVAPDLVQTDLEQCFLDVLRAASGELDGPMERHGVRCFLLVERLADRRGLEIDREVALCASLVHDIGLYPAVSHGGVYTDEGGELAARLFREARAGDERARLVADACAYHHALRDQSHRGAEVELLRLADRTEVSAGLLRAGLGRGEVREVFEAAPRDGFYRAVAVLLAPALRERPLTLPRIFKVS